MPLTYSPLRYPGGKSRLANFMKLLIEANDLKGGVYAEPFAGGAGVALSLLLDGYMGKVIINDIDPAIHAFWHSVLHDHEALCKIIIDTPVNIDAWHNQKRILAAHESYSLLEVGFATFFLNRTNRSGILNAGVIGGLGQRGDWKIDARYQKNKLISKIQTIASMKKNIELHNLDVRAFIKRIGSKLPKQSLIYFDPPYFDKGQMLYLNALRPDDHLLIAHSIMTEVSSNWVTSYDNVASIRDMYSSYSQEYCDLNYTAANRYQGSEVLIYSKGLNVPEVENPFRLTKKLFMRLKAA